MEDSSKIVPNKDEVPVTVTGTIAAGADLGTATKIVNVARTSHRLQSPPGFALMVFSKLDKKTVDAATKALDNVKGVDARALKADVKKSQISVTIAGTDKVTIADVLTALEDAGVNASLAKAKD